MLTLEESRVLERRIRERLDFIQRNISLGNTVRYWDGHFHDIKLSELCSFDNRIVVGKTWAEYQDITTKELYAVDSADEFIEGLPVPEDVVRILCKEYTAVAKSAKYKWLTEQLQDGTQLSILTDTGREIYLHRVSYDEGCITANDYYDITNLWVYGRNDQYQNVEDRYPMWADKEYYYSDADVYQWRALKK